MTATQSENPLAIRLTKEDDFTDVGRTFESMLPKLKEAEEKFKEHIEKTKAEIAQLSPVMCEIHEDEPCPVDMEHTFGKSWLNEKFSPQYGDCPKCVAERKEILVNEAWRKTGVPQATRHATFENFETRDLDPVMAAKRREALARTRKQVARGNGFIIMVGKYGTGKTHLACAAMRAMGGGQFVTQADMIGALRQTYADNSGQDEMVDKYRNAKVFVLDELTSEVYGKDIAAFLYRILSHRHDNGRLTIITSNEQLDTVLEILGGRLADRIRQSYVVANFVWESARKELNESH